MVRIRSLIHHGNRKRLRVRHCRSQKSSVSILYLRFSPNSTLDIRPLHKSHHRHYRIIRLKTSSKPKRSDEVQPSKPKIFTPNQIRLKISQFHLHEQIKKIKTRTLTNEPSLTQQLFHRSQSYSQTTFSTPVQIFRMASRNWLKIRIFSRCSANR